jgi:hypothetical protein
MLRTRIVPSGPTLIKVGPKARTLNGAFFIFFTIWYYKFFFFFFKSIVWQYQYNMGLYHQLFVALRVCVYIYIYMRNSFSFFLFVFVFFLSYRAFYVYFIF